MKLTVVIVALLGAIACNRAATDENARRAAGEVRDVAARAGDQLADSWLTTKIQAQFFADDDIKARYINVTSDDGIVTLKGRVDDQNARTQAVQIATNTDGVTRVVDQLVVGPVPTAGEIAEQTNSAWITTQIQARFFADTGIRGREIGVATNDGVVTLSGHVDDQQEKERAVAIARGIEGVTRVDDRLLVQPAAASTAPVATAGVAPPDDGRVTSSIQAKFYLDNLVKGRRIDVSTQQGVVTLRGEVASDNERAQALLLARTTEGVDRVEDGLTVNPALGEAATSSTPQAPTVAPQAQSQDDALARGIEDKFSADRQVKTGSIEVSARDGVVLLDGTVPTNAAKQRALTIARGTDGVTQVVDRIRVGR
jgi:hyperosmotically inducible periplasmic protein